MPEKNKLTPSFIGLCLEVFALLLLAFTALSGKFTEQLISVFAFAATLYIVLVHHFVFEKSGQAKIKR